MQCNVKGCTLVSRCVHLCAVHECTPISVQCQSIASASPDTAPPQLSGLCSSQLFNPPSGFWQNDSDMNSKFKSTQTNCVRKKRRCDTTTKLQLVLNIPTILTFTLVTFCEVFGISNSGGSKIPEQVKLWRKRRLCPAGRLLQHWSPRRSSGGRHTFPTWAPTSNS